MANFAIIGLGGFIAPRHLEAIKNLGHNVVIACDPKDSVGIIDRYFPDCPFFTDFERFEVAFEGFKGTNRQIDYVSICSPNYLHEAHIRFALRNKAHAICEKPLVLHDKDIERLSECERTSGRRVFTVLQLRLHEAILALKQNVERGEKEHYDVKLVYMTSRGPWYLESWKADAQKSGGLSTNIGVHFFDMLTWIFGPAKNVQIAEMTPTFEMGSLELAKATVNWSLTIDRSRIPAEILRSGKTTFRSIQIDGEEFEFSDGFTELHKKVYENILSGGGYGLNDARPSIALVEEIRRLGQLR